MTEKVKELNGASLDPIADKLAQLRELLPEAFAEDKIDFEKLKAALGQEIELGERYGLGWKGKSQVFRAIQEPITKTLRPDRDNSVNFDESQNLFIEGDNLEALKILQKGYYGKVKMIYIDPPYNTGNDFVYNDKFAQTRTSYEQEAGIRDDEGNITSTSALQRNSRDSGHFHSNWLNMIYPRLYLARTLLRQDGVIFVSIDDNEVQNLRLVMNEIFGEENFIAQIIWQKVYAPKNTAKYFSDDHEYILVYARSAETWLPNRLPRTEESNDRYSNQDNDPRGPWKPSDLTARNYYGEGKYEITGPTGKSFKAPTGSYWRVSQKKFQELNSDNRIWWGKTGGNMPAQKRFLSEVQQGLTPQTLWLYKEVGHTQEAKQQLLEDVSYHETENVLNTVKPVRLIQRMLQLGTEPNEADIVLDFFAGSGTTALAVMQQNLVDGGNRRYICVQISEPLPKPEDKLKTLTDVIRERIKNGAKKINNTSGNQFDLGFKAFNIASTNFKVWDSTVKDAHKLEQQMQAMFDPIRKDSKEEDLLVELILKSGIPLTATRQRIDINGQAYWQIADNEMFICLSEHLSKEMLEDILAKRPAKLIILNRSLADDVYKANVILQLQGLQIDFQVI